MTIKLTHEPATAGVVKKCQKLIKEFQGEKVFPGRLTQIETELAGRYTYLMERKADAQFHQNSAYWTRKISHSRHAIKARNSKDVKSMDLANHIAIGKIAEQADGAISNIDQENLSVWRYEHLNGFCKGLDKVLIAIAHRLKDAEREKQVSLQETG